MIKKIKLFIFVFFCVLYTKSQTNIYGEYEGHFLGTFTIHLKPSKIYTSTFYPSCATYFSVRYDSGTYFINADTIFTHSNMFKKLSSKKYLIIKNDSFVLLTDIFHSDSILPIDYFGRLNNWEYTINNFMYKRSFYSENGNLNSRATNNGKKDILTYYYPNGNIKRIEIYKKQKKCNDWFYYSEDGRLINIETYRNNKLLE